MLFSFRKRKIHISHHRAPNSIYIRVLARPYLMTLYVIFPIHYPIRSKSVFKAIIPRKKQWIVLRLLKNKSIYQWRFMCVA